MKNKYGFLSFFLFSVYGFYSTSFYLCIIIPSLPKGKYHKSDLKSSQKGNKIEDGYMLTGKTNVWSFLS